MPRGEVAVILRVISGTAGGLGLKTRKGTTTRPTSDKVKGALFNIVTARISDSEVLDVFAGTGSLGIEALSRGALKAVFIDKSPICTSVIKENLAHTKFADKAEVYTADFVSGLEKLYLEGKKFDLVLLDPPYNKNFIQEALKIMTNNDIMKADGIIAAEHSISDSLPECIGRLKDIDTRKYGDTAIKIYAAN